ncbi:MAG: prepilin-type N-terminal cleavage/methylation domain-containing protein [Deltaproteobacteria bacterium]|nr:prepilin-type N-terminal cleavage/methylation domain-containing protein [Deltaproteobacteria bacterium]
MQKLNNNRGYSMIEVFIAMVVLSIVLLGMAGLINITVTINRNSAEKTVAITLAQDKMEETITKGYSNISSTNQTLTEAYAAMPNYLTYKRITEIKINKPDKDIKLITVDVYWNNDNRQVRLQSLISNSGLD